jgi:hypothetical protein
MRLLLFVLGMLIFLLWSEAARAAPTVYYDLFACQNGMTDLMNHTSHCTSLLVNLGPVDLIDLEWKQRG